MARMNQRLNSLYPFLDPEAKGQEPRQLLNSISAKVDESVRVKQEFFTHQGEALLEAARCIAGIYRGGGRMFSMGNGGSSCDAAHFAVEFQHPITAGRPALAAFNLCMDTAMLSAVGNDLGVEHQFARQLEAHARTGDGLIAFSTSGNSANLLAGMRKARELEMHTLALLGGDGGDMLASGLLDHSLVAPTNSIHRVQETHLMCYHILWDLVHSLLASQRGKLGASQG